MNGGLKIGAELFGTLTRELLADAPNEACAIGHASYDEATETWLLGAAAQAKAEDYDGRSKVHASLRSGVVVDAANRARSGGERIVMIHTHPVARGCPQFSDVDDAGEAELAEYFERRAPGGRHLALVIGPEGCRARKLGTKREIPVCVVGANILVFGHNAGGNGAEEWMDRQVRAFGSAGQRIIGQLQVGVIGTGGTGSLICQQLAHLGVNSFVLVDPDKIEATNLNRVVGSTATDVGRSKVDVAAEMIAAVRPHALIEKIVGDVVDAAVANRLTACDFLFLCTDSDASRAVVNQIAYQFLVPTIDMGTSITAVDGAVTHITGRVQMLAPGLPCLLCCNTLNPEQIRRELMTPDERAQDQYIQGETVPQPAVISINSTVSSLAVTMFLGAATHIPADSRWQRYDGVSGQVRLMSADREPGCIVCSGTGALSRGKMWPLPTRAEQSDG
jgi:molybdopterin/thiamine biosynthesis adenylyltransferase